MHRHGGVIHRRSSGSGLVILECMGYDCKRNTKEEARALFDVVFICCCSNLLSCQPTRTFYTDKTKSTLNLPFLNLEHVLCKQLQIDIKCTFKYEFLLHVLILKSRKQRFPCCKPLSVIWIQVIVVFNFIYICSCYKYLCSARNLPPPHTKQCKHCRHFSFAVWRRRLRCVILVDPSVVFNCSVKIWQPNVHQCQELTG
jgi:hypothetical protein